MSTDSVRIVFMYRSCENDVRTAAVCFTPSRGLRGSLRPRAPAATGPNLVTPAIHMTAAHASLQRRIALRETRAKCWTCRAPMYKVMSCGHTIAVVGCTSHFCNDVDTHAILDICVHICRQRPAHSTQFDVQSCASYVLSRMRRNTALLTDMNVYGNAVTVTVCDTSASIVSNSLSQNGYGPPDKSVA